MVHARVPEVYVMMKVTLRLFIFVMSFETSAIFAAVPTGDVPFVFAVAIDVVGVPSKLTLTAITGYVVAGYPVLEPNRPIFPPFPPNLRGSSEIATANPSRGGLPEVLVRNVAVKTNDLVRSSRYFV